VGIGQGLAQAGAVLIVNLPTDWLDLKRELLALLEQSAPDRAATLATVRETRPQRAAELERLLRDAESEFLELPAWAGIAAATNVVLETPPERIGPWRIGMELGRGGMGTVYRAERDDGSFAQTVAVKLIRAELVSGELRRRFDSERRILASLDHPNVARLLDAGTTEQGAPYLVLEFVAGEPIDTFCDTRSLDVSARLSLFRLVCGAVHAAHQRLILHRDLKTANVLVDSSGQPKLLDFGIAKLLVADTQHDDLTRVGFARPLTPEWSSPEQLRGEPLSTASDVYALGVLLYLLLTGKRPHSFAQQSPSAFAAAIEASRAVPLRVAARDQPPAGLSTQRLRGDIERLAQKALAADIRERYATVAELDADVARLLAGHPIAAHPRSLAYRFGKLLLRNRVASAALAITAIGLLGATVFSVRQATLAEQERQRAERRFNDVRRIANVVLFDLNDSLANISGTLAVREVLVDNALRYLDDLARETGREPELLTELATAYERIAEVQGMPSWPSHGRSGNALASLGRALDLHRRANAVSGASSLAEARVLSNLGSILAARGESSAGRDAQLQSEVALQAAPADTRGVDWVLQLARIQVAAGDATWELGDIPGAGAQYERALHTVKAGRERFTESTTLMRQTGVVEQRLGDAAAMRRDWQQARLHHGASLAADDALLLLEPGSLELQRDLGTDLSRVGAVAFMLGQHREALAAHQRALELRERLSMADPGDARARDDAAESHLHVAQSLANLGRAREAAAEAVLAMERWRSLADTDPDNARMRSSLAGALAALGRCEAVLGMKTSALARIAEARRIRMALTEHSPDFSQASDAITSLDALDAQVRAGAIPSGNVAFVDPWQ
jgi:non-specific serine/threonine protein kinase/serine/threonine-protein kinase